MDGRFYSFTILIFTLVSTCLYSYPTPVDFDGKASRWNLNKDNSGPIRFEIKAQDDDDEITSFYHPAIVEAADLWSNIETSYFHYENDQDADNAHVTIHLDSNFEGGDFSSGYATFDEHDSSGPSHCSIHVQIKVGGSFVNISKTVLHELGHCLGLGHSLIPEAIMSYRSDRNKFGLDTDDIAAVSRLYSTHEGDAKLPPGCAVGSNSHGNLWVLLVLLAPILLWLPTHKHAR